MADKLSWIFELVDKVSKPAKDATGATGSFEKELRKVEAQIERVKSHPLEFKQLQAAKKEMRELAGGSRSFAERFEEMGAAVKKVGFVQNLMLGAEALRFGFEMGEKVVDVVYDIGKELIGAAGHAERFRVAFKSLAGEDGGTEALEYIEKIKKSSELSGAQLKEMSAQLITAGFHVKDLGNALPAALDIAGFKGGGLEATQAAIAAMAKIRESGKVGDKQLMHLGLGENSDARLLDRMAKTKGTSSEAIKKAMEAGKLDPQEILHEVYEMIIERQHGALGTTAEKMTQTVTGKLGKLRQLPEEIFEKWADSPGFDKFSSALGKVLEKLDPEGPNGKKIFAAIDTVSGKVVDLIGDFANGDGIDRFIEKVTSIGPILDTTKSILDTIITASEILATVWAGSTIISAFTSLAELMPGMATAAGAMVGPLGLAAAALASIGVAYHEIAKTMEELGGWTRVKKDFTDWLGNEQAAKSDSVANDTSPDWKKRLATGNPMPNNEPAIPAISSRMAPGSAQMSQTANIHPGAIVIQVPPGTANADEIANAVNETLPGAVQQSMERMAVSSGVL